MITSRHRSHFIQTVTQVIRRIRGNVAPFRT